MPFIDYSKKLEEFDPTGQFEVLKSFPMQIGAGLDAADGLDPALLPDCRRGNAVIAGMGGSAIGGDILRGLADYRSNIPVQVRRNYRLPDYSGPDTSVFVISYSGDTAEALSAYDEGGRRGCRRVVITTGGKLAACALRDGIPLVRIPGGCAPRFALGYLFFSLLRTAEKARLLTLPEGELEETIDAVEKCTAAYSDWSKPGNAAVTLAERLHDVIPVVYSGHDYLEAVNLRWRCQFEENAKTLAWGNVIPEMNHNEIVGWERNPDLLRRLHVIALRDREESAEITARMDATLDLISPHAAGVDSAEGGASAPQARIFELICLGDWSSFYLAVGTGTDPFPIHKINALKNALSNSKLPPA